jgi:hypothetical protein
VVYSAIAVNGVNENGVDKRKSHLVVVYSAIAVNGVKENGVIAITN